MALPFVVCLTDRTLGAASALPGEGVSRGEDTLAQIESLGAGRSAAAAPVRDLQPDACETPITLEVVTEADPAAWDEAERFVYSVFRDAGFCQPSARSWVEETDDFRADSTLHVARAGTEIVGCVRTMLGSYTELPIGQFPHSVGVPDGLLCEFGSLAVHTGVRGLGVVNELHRAAVQWAVRQRAVGFCMLVEPWSVEFFRDAYGVPLVQTSGARDYMGSLTVAAVVTFRALFDNLLDSRPGMYRWATETLTPDDFEAYAIPILLD